MEEGWVGGPQTPLTLEASLRTFFLRDTATSLLLPEEEPARLAYAQPFRETAVVTSDCLKVRREIIILSPSHLWLLCSSFVD